MACPFGCFAFRRIAPLRALLKCCGSYILFAAALCYNLCATTIVEAKARPLAALHSEPIRRKAKCDNAKAAQGYDLTQKKGASDVEAPA